MGSTSLGRSLELLLLESAFNFSKICASNVDVFVYCSDNAFSLSFCFPSSDRNVSEVTHRDLRPSSHCGQCDESCPLGIGFLHPRHAIAGAISQSEQISLFNSCKCKSLLHFLQEIICKALADGSVLVADSDIVDY